MSVDLTSRPVAEPSPAQRPSHWRRWAGLAVAVVLVVAAAGWGIAQRISGDQWSTVWSEDFDGPAGAAPSAEDWQQATGTSYPVEGAPAQWGTGEIETYTTDRANAQLDGKGNLVITAIRDEAGQWTSARLESRRTDFQAPAGGVLKVEATVQVPEGGAGYWPAFWMLGADNRKNPITSWPGVGEIDILEHKGGSPAELFATFHCGVAPGGPCNENNGRGSSTRSTDGASFGAAMHTYSVEWDRSSAAEEIRWYVDGRQYHSVRSADLPADVWEKATNHGYFILLNLAIGGSFPGPTDETTQPKGSMIVDSVRVSKR